MNFLIDNLYLIVIALVSGGLLLWPLLKRGGGSTALSPLEATQLINHRNAIVVDVRDAKDFAAGSLAAACHLPFDDLATRASELVRFKSRPVLIVCGAGQQSAKATEQFKTQGFDEAYSLSGGISAWRQAGLPLVQPGRDNARPVVKEASRRSKGDQRSDRRGSKPSNAVPLAVETPVVPDPMISPTQAANDADPVSNRVKELS